MEDGQNGPVPGSSGLPNCHVGQLHGHLSGRNFIFFDEGKFGSP